MGFNIKGWPAHTNTAIAVLLFDEQLFAIKPNNYRFNLLQIAAIPHSFQPAKHIFKGKCHSSYFFIVDFVLWICFPLQIIGSCVCNFWTQCFKGIRKYCSQSDKDQDINVIQTPLALFSTSSKHHSVSSIPDSILHSQFNQQYQLQVCHGKFMGSQD